MSNKQEAPMIYESPIEFRNWANMVQWQQKKKKKRRPVIIILSVYCTSIKYQHRIPFCIFAFKVSCGLSKVYIYIYIYIYGCGKVGRSDVFPFQNQNFSLLKINCPASISYIYQLHMIYIPNAYGALAK